MVETLIERIERASQMAMRTAAESGGNSLGNYNPSSGQPRKNRPISH
jgi:hypothetical protein